MPKEMTADRCSICACGKALREACRKKSLCIQQACCKLMDIFDKANEKAKGDQAMPKEMTAITYLKEKERMSKACKVGCENCPLASDYNGFGKACGELEGENPEAAIDIVQKWSEEHPVKTYAEDFKEKFPSCECYPGGVPAACRGQVYGTGGVPACATTLCEDCWNEEYKEA